LPERVLLGRITSSSSADSFRRKAVFVCHLWKKVGQFLGKFPSCIANEGSRFTQSGTLNRHSRTHAGKQLFLCPQCPRQFNTSQNLAQHACFHEQAAASVASKYAVVSGGELPSISSSTSSSPYDVDMVSSLTLWESQVSRFRLDYFISSDMSGAGGENVPCSGSIFAFDAQIASRLEEPVNLDIPATEIVVPDPAMTAKVTMLLGSPPSERHPALSISPSAMKSLSHFPLSALR
jgi:hypothetical protein